MTVVKVAALAVLLMLPVISHAEGGGERAIEWYKSMQDGRMTVQTRDVIIDKQTVAEQSEQPSDTKR